MDALSLGATRRSAGPPCSARPAPVDGERRCHERGATPARESLLPHRPKKSNLEQMKTDKFISELRRAPSNQLIFVDLDGHTVDRGYHLTELKAASLQAVDCGGQTNQWQETIAQLWVPSDPVPDYMTVGKFLKIFDKVGGMIPLNLDTEIRIEYGDDNFFPLTYHVDSVAQEQGVTRVSLVPSATTCKARDRRIALLKTDSCCAKATRWVRSMRNLKSGCCASRATSSSTLNGTRSLNICSISKGAASPATSLRLLAPPRSA